MASEQALGADVVPDASNDWRYSHLGDWFASVCVAGLALLTVLSLRKTRT